jgi:very-short-patch-repair endonuclease
MSQRQQFAKDLRQNMTEEERFVWSRLRSRRFAGFKFRLQVVLGNYMVDFVCFAAKLILELDGGQAYFAM